MSVDKLNVVVASRDVKQPAHLSRLPQRLSGGIGWPQQLFNLSCIPLASHMHR